MTTDNGYTYPNRMWRQSDSDNLRKISGLVGALVAVAVLGLLLGVVGMIWAGRDADKTHEQLDSLQRAVAVSPGNPASPTPKPGKG